MHRTTSTPRRWAWGLLALGLLLSWQPLSATAQEVIAPPRELPGGPGAAGVKSLVLPRDSTQQVELSTRQVLKEVKQKGHKKSDVNERHRNE